MKRTGLTALMIAGVLLAAMQGFAQDAGHGRAVVTVLAKHNEVAPSIAQQDVSAKVNGKDSTVAGWTPFKGADDGLELVLLIDAGARNLGRQFDEIRHFVDGLGPHTRVAVGYMQNGRSAMAGPLSTDHKQVLSELHLPVGPTTNPYFSISDLAQHWPSDDRSSPDHNIRREVVLLSDGIDPENRRFDPEDPYVQSAINDSVRAGLVVYTLYWRSGREGGDNSPAVTGGQSLLGELSDATGGTNYWTGEGNPVTFQPYFDDLMRRFGNQYALDVTARLDRKPTIDTLKLKVEGLGLQVTAPQKVYVHAASSE